MVRKVYNIPNAKASGPYSGVVEAGDFLFFSGQTAMNNQNTRKIYHNVQEETECCFALLFELLEKAGLTTDEVVKVNVYLVDMQDFQAVNEIYQNKFNLPYPARTCIAVRELPLGARIEIEMIARRAS